MAPPLKGGFFIGRFPVDTDALIDGLIKTLPDDWEIYAPFLFLMLSGLCNILAIGLKPPVWGSRHYVVLKIYYLVVTWGALNLGRASNRLQCERTGLMVKREDVDAAQEALTKAGFDVMTYKPSSQKQK